MPMSLFNAGGSDPPSVAILQLSHLFRRAHNEPLLALENVSLTVAPGEFVSIVGASGCGKSTLLRLLAGLDQPTSGELCISGAPPGQLLGASGYMPQRDLLMPWRSVLDNAIVALEYASIPRRQARERASALLPTFGLAGFEDAYPAALSGGMRQRVSLLRTIMTGKRLLLLDEPFGALDAITRAELHEWLNNLLTELKATVILVTHDLEEAAYLSDTVYVMSDRPGHIADSVPIPLPRPRPYQIISSITFTACKHQLLDALRQAHHTGAVAMLGRDR